jgi:hypothetical protein
LSLLSGKRVLSIVVAGAVALGVGAVGQPAVAAPETGSIAGSLTDGPAPVRNALVTVYDTNFQWAGSTLTNAAGAFQVTGLAAGEYKVQFSIGSYSQWSYQKSSFDEADLITVTAGQITTITEAIRPYGVVSGRVTNADGTPAADVIVMAQGAGGVSSATTDSTGFYAIKYLTSGDYRVSFRRSFSSPVQYAHNATRYADADLISVTVGTATSVDQTLLPYSTVTGTITDGGQPAAGVQVTLHDVTTNESFSASTDSAGQYEVSVWPGTYIVSVTRDGLVQYVPGQLSRADAQQFVVSDGPTVIDEELLSTGTITGVLTHADGSPVAYAEVSAASATTTLFTYTDEQGRYTLSAYPGDYRIGFWTPYGTQWANGRSSVTQADPVTVVAGASTTVDEQLLPFESVTVTAVDSLTGAPVNEFCVQAEFGYTCTDTGTATDVDVLPGRYLVTVYPRDDVHVRADATLEVTSGAPATLTVSLAPGATITTTTVDRKSGAPVANACLELIPVTEPWRLGMGAGICSDASGTVTASRITPGKYKVFVWARDGVHGHQWVGPGGGVGLFKKARTITINPGQTVTLPAIRLDKAGTITGVVTDEVTGAPVTGGVVALSSYHYGFGGSANLVGIDAQGRYTMRNLGPYQWTLLFAATGYAQEWMGDTANRDRAAHVKVKEGQTTTYNATVGQGTTVTGQIVASDGSPVSSARIEFVNAETGEYMGVADLWLPGGPTYTAQVKGPQPVKVHYTVTVYGQPYSGWVGGAGFADADVFHIPRTAQHTLNLTVPPPGA